MAASFIPLGDLPTGIFRSYATNVSSDGRYIVGVGSSNSAVDEEAVLWTRGGGMVGLGHLADNSQERSYGTDVSDDGSVVVGFAYSQGNKAFRWTQEDGLTDIGFGEAAAITSDGSSMLVGNQGRWTSGGGWVSLGDLPGGLTSSYARAVSDVCCVIAGYSFSDSGQEAFRWRSNTGLVGLGDLPGGSFGSQAWAISADGEVIVGTGTSASGSEAFRWTAEGGMVGLGDLPGGSFLSQAFGVSGDGSVVVGTSNSATGPEPYKSEPFVWTQETGMQRLVDVLLAGGVDGLDDWKLLDARAISADGKWVVGAANNPDGYLEAYIANIEPVPVPAAIWLFGSALGLLGWLRSRRIS